MNQYLKLLCSCRVPQPVRDYVFVAPKEMSKHVVVAYKNEVTKLCNKFINAIFCFSWTSFWKPGLQLLGTKIIVMSVIYT